MSLFGVCGSESIFVLLIILHFDDSHFHVLTFSAFDDVRIQRRLRLNIRRSLPDVDAVFNVLTRRFGK